MSLKGAFAGLAGTNADSLCDIGNKDLPITDLAGVGSFGDRFDSPGDPLIRDHQFHFQLGQEVNDVFSPPVKLGMASLAAKTLRFNNGHSLHAYFVKRFFYVIKLERFYDRFNLLHFRLTLSLIFVGSSSSMPRMRDILLIEIRDVTTLLHKFQPSLAEN